MSKTIVFGGWAVPPGILKNVFGNDAVYVDVNHIMPKLFASCQLRGDWPEIVISECQLTKKNPPGVIAGWSTGAMLAYAAATRICPSQQLILLSATPCFCRKDDFRFGTNPSVLDQMINALRKDRDAVLQSFYERCGLQYDPDAISNYTTDELSSGLLFLKQADLRPLAPLLTKIIFRHGQTDQIIPIAASKYFSEQTSGEHIEVSGGHVELFNPCATTSCSLPPF